MNFRVCTTINRKYVAKPKRRLHVSHRFEIGVKADATKQAVLAGFAIVQFCFSLQSKQDL